MEREKEPGGSSKPAEHDTEPKNPTLPKEQKRQDERQQSAMAQQQRSRTMSLLLENPFDPDEYREAFAAALVPLCDAGTDIDLEIDKACAECVLTMDGVNYRVTIVAERVGSQN